MILLAPVKSLGGIATWACVVREHWPEPLDVIDTSPWGRQPSQELSPRIAALGLIHGLWVWARALTRALRQSEPIWVTVSPSVGFRVRDTPFLHLARALRIRTVVHVHGSFADGLLGSSNLSRRWARTGLRAASEVVVLDKGTQTLLKSVSGRPVRRIPNFVASSQPATRPQRTGVHRVLFVGRVAPDKGSDVLLALARAQPSRIELSVVGPLDPGMADEFLREASALGVRLTGRLDSARVREEMVRSDALILPSHHEGFPMVVLEAMSVGLPVVTSDVGACREILVEGTLEPAGVVLPNPVDIGDDAFVELAVEALGVAAWPLGLAGGPDRVATLYSPDVVVPQMRRILAGEAGG